MSNAVEDVRGRVDGIERTQARFDERLGHVERVIDRTAQGVERLLERDASRPTPITPKAVLMTLLGATSLIGSVGVAVWWFIANAPSVQDLRTRMASSEYKYKQLVHEIEQRTKDRYSSSQALIDCLRAEIANRKSGWRCTHPKRGIRDDDWQTHIRRPGS